jgi:hypothetical protein
MDEPVRSRHRTAHLRGLTSPDPVTAHPRPKATSAGTSQKNLWTSRTKVSGRKATPTATIKITWLDPSSRTPSPKFGRWIEAYSP